jgi:hypothetical protein
MRYNRLFDLGTPGFGQRLLWLTLLVAAYLSFQVHLDYSYLEKANPVSVFGYLFDLDWGDPRLVTYSRTIFLVSAALWFFRRAVPWSGWISAISFTFLISVYWENLPWFRHKYILPNLILISMAMWYHFYRREVRSQATWAEFFRAPLQPVWVKLLTLWSLAMFYGLSGISKLRGGWTLGDGTSLQLWFHLLVEEGHPLGEVVVNSADVSAFLQSGALLVELSCFLAIFLRFYRVPLALMLTSFHLTVQWTFGIPFLTNIPLVLAILLPLSTKKEMLTAATQSSGAKQRTEESVRDPAEARSD